MNSVRTPIVKGFIYFSVYSAIGLWAIIGFFVWIPLLFSGVAVFCGAIMHAMLTQNPQQTVQAKKQIEEVVSLYPSGFQNLNDFIRRLGGGQYLGTTPSNQSVDYLSIFVKRLGIVLLFWVIVVSLFFFS